jgi:hypothetical protein
MLILPYVFLNSNGDKFKEGAVRKNQGLEFSLEQTDLKKS